MLRNWSTSIKSVSRIFNTTLSGAKNLWFLSRTPKVLIMSGYGINCETESKNAFELAGAKADIVHINDLISKKKKMSNYDIIMFPGGFSYGDDTGSGQAFANKIKNNLWEDLKQFINQKKLILGICNGFQIMTHLGLFADGKRINAMESNNSNRYECRWVHIKHNNTNCVFTKDINMTHLPVAHGEGRFFCSIETLNKLKDNNQIVFTYCGEKGESAEGKYPLNPNGALADVAGICDKTGRIMGMMPHPERAIYSFNEPEFHLKKEKAKRNNQLLPEFIESNLKIFKNAVDYVKNKPDVKIVDNKMNVLIIGSGGREHSLALKVAESRLLNKLFAVPGNPGIEEVAECHNIDIMDNDALVNFAKEKKIDLVIIGPEAPLVNGLADELEKNNIRVFGPNKKAAQFEGSKIFARRFMQKYNLPSVEFREFTDIEQAKDYIKEKGAPIVVKADGLAAGKGVFVAQTEEEAIDFAKECLLNNKFGQASSKIIVEECLIGEEASYLVFMDSETFQPMVYSQDHKPIFEGDKGPNTGGMGAYSPAPILEGHEKELEDKIIKPFLKGIKQEGIDYKGVLYVGLMKTNKGLKILEFNCRFGDPETQIILPRLKTDSLEVMNAVIDKKLGSLKLDWSPQHCVAVVLASGGYPDSYEKGKLITGLKDVEDVQVIQAGTKKENGNIYTNGGRVLNIVALGPTLKQAVDKAYSNIPKINFEGMFFRKDIAKKELDRQND
jgi:phosphoribosylamine--glycine ligase